MPSFDFQALTPHAPELRKILGSYAPRLSYREESGWLSTVFTVIGEDPYLSNASAELAAWDSNRLADEAW